MKTFFIHSGTFRNFLAFFVLPFIAASCYATENSLSYRLQSSGMDRITEVDDPSRGSTAKVFKMILRSSDVRSSGGLRTEIVPERQYARSGVRWYGMSFFIPEDWVDTDQPIVLLQLHTSQKEALLSPPISVVARGKDMHLILYTSPLSDGPGTKLSNETSTSRRVRLGGLLKNKWSCFVFNVKWDSNPGKGRVVVWMNGSLLFEARNEAVGYKTWLGNYPKIGLYAPSGSLGAKERSVYVDTVVVGGEDSNYKEVYARTVCGKGGA